MIGIDLGTTHSLVAVWRKEGPVLVPNSLGDLLTPSVVGLDDNGDIITGKAARERLVTHPQLTVSHFKRQMGTQKTYTMGKHCFCPEELSAFVLRDLKSDAEKYLGMPVVDAVVTVPAYFNDMQRKSTIAAAKIAGLNVLRLVNEPTAASLAYGLHHKSQQCRFMVFDLGGGTFDISVLEWFENVMEVRACAGDCFLGGDDFNQVIYEAFLKQLNDKYDIKKEQIDTPTRQSIQKQIEDLKIALSCQATARLKVNINGRIMSWTLDRSHFESIVESLIHKLRKPVEQALRDARLKAGELEQIVLVGGATKMPVIRTLVAKLFGRIPSRQIDPELVVAQGAAVLLHMIGQKRKIQEMVMTDVCPYTLGIETVQYIGPQAQTGSFLPVIERNSVVPLSRVESVTTVTDFQSVIELRIFQGENRLVRDNLFLGKLRIQVPAAKSGKEKVEVRFTYDINGILEVEAHVLSNGKVTSIIIEENPGALSKEQIQARIKKLQHLKRHPREQDENLALLARAERIYQETLGELRKQVGVSISSFQAILNNQNDLEIRKAQSKFRQMLDELDQAPL